MRPDGLWGVRLPRDTQGESLCHKSSYTVERFPGKCHLWGDESKARMLSLGGGPALEPPHFFIP